MPKVLAFFYYHYIRDVERKSLYMCAAYLAIMACSFSVDVKFIIGDSGCGLHEDDLVDKYSCRRWHTSASGYYKNKHASYNLFESVCMCVYFF